MNCFRNFRIAPAILVLLFCLPLPSLGDWIDLSAGELKTMMESDQNPYLLNPLSDIEYNEGHIPGSVNIPLHMIMRSDKMPDEQDAIIVTYCLSKK